MVAYQISELCQVAASDPAIYREFLRKPSMSMGLYVLQPGATDPQSPHQEDEVYVVLEGTALIRVAEEDREVSPGTIVFVDKQVEHRFHGIQSELKVLVFFAPAESKAE